MNPRKILRFIRSHGFPCYLRANGSIRVATECFGVEGVKRFEQSDIPATLSAARAWLGY